ncbi:MAG: 30S ribosomal protein S17 [Pyrinomonadaceae bacterium]
MPRKKKDEVEETVSVGEEVAAPDVAAETPNVEAAAEEVAAAPAEESVIEAAPAVAEKPKKAAKSAPKAKEPANAYESAAAVVQKISKRAEKIGIVSSDKMTKTVTVRVDRLVKHPIYRKYVKKRKKFMAHDEMGAKIGDKVKIVETRPLSARKRWRVVEILHKAEL